MSDYNISGATRRLWGVTAPPWVKDPACTNSWVADLKRMTMGGGNNISAGGWAAEKGGTNFGTSSLQFDLGYAGKGLGYVHPGASGYATADFLAAAISGTNQPFSVFASLQVPTAQAIVGPVTPILWSFARSSSAAPRYHIPFTGSNEDCYHQHIDDTGSGGTHVKTAGTLSLGTNPVVLATIFDGTVLDTYLNTTHVDSSFAFSTASATSLDQFTLFALRAGGAAVTDFADYRLRRWVWRPGTAPSAQVRTQYITYMMREAGL